MMMMIMTMAYPLAPCHLALTSGAWSIRSALSITHHLADLVHSSPADAGAIRFILAHLLHLRSVEAEGGGSDIE